MKGVDDLIDLALSRQKKQRYKGMWATDTMISQTIEDSITRVGPFDQTFWEVSQTSNETLPCRCNFKMDQHKLNLPLYEQHYCSRHRVDCSALDRQDSAFPEADRLCSRRCRFKVRCARVRSTVSWDMLANFAFQWAINQTLEMVQM